MPKRDLEAEIYEFIKEKTSGVTITEISRKKGFSRNTVAKYAAILELKKKIFSKKIGVYQLFFSTDMDLFSRTFTMSYYKALLAGLKKKFPNDNESFKDIGRESLDYIEALLGPVILKEVKSLNVNRMIRLYYQLFGKVIPSLDMIQPTIEMSMRKKKDIKNIIILKFTNTEFLDNSGDFLYHYYIIAGILEEVWQREVDKNVIVNVETVHLSEIKDDSYIELSVQFSPDK